MEQVMELSERVDRIEDRLALVEARLGLGRRAVPAPAIAPRRRAPTAPLPTVLDAEREPILLSPPIRSELREPPAQEQPEPPAAKPVRPRYAPGRADLLSRVEARRIAREGEGTNRSIDLERYLGVAVLGRV